MVRSSDLLEMGESARIAHSSWLTRRLHSTPTPPRIPVRRVSRGGFTTMMSRPHGPKHAQRWWRLVFERLENEDD